MARNKNNDNYNAVLCTEFNFFNNFTVAFKKDPDLMIDQFDG